MKTGAFHSLLCGTFLLAGASLSAVTLGQFDDFQDLTPQFWMSGAPNPNPPSIVADGGPAGAGDAFLQIVSTGGGGPGSRLVSFNGAQWSGDYLGGGISGLQMNLSNNGPSPLEIRLNFQGSGGNFSSVAGVPVPVGSGWQSVFFPIGAGDLTGGSNYAATMTAVNQLRILHNTVPNRRGAPVVGSLGVDNLTAIPEPAHYGLALASAFGILLCLRRRTATAKL